MNNEEFFLRIAGLEDDLEYCSTELSYLHDFISQMGLWDEFIYFRKHAEPVQGDDDPFPLLKL